MSSYVPSISINLEGVDAALGQASCLQERTIVAQLHALAREVVSLEQLHPEVLSMLRRIMTNPLAKLQQTCLPSTRRQGLLSKALY